MNDSVKSVVSLVVICLVVTLALSAVNYFTAPVIAENNAKAVQGSFAEALPGADGFEELEPAADAPETATNCRTGHLRRRSDWRGAQSTLSNGDRSVGPTWPTS